MGLPLRSAAPGLYWYSFRLRRPMAYGICPLRGRQRRPDQEIRSAGN